MKVQEQVPRNALVWIIISLFTLVAPHVGRIPLWVLLVYLVAALWRFIFSKDLVDMIRTQNRPTHELLDVLLAEPRRLARRRVDGLWARLVDVPRFA